MGENTKIEWAHHTLNFWIGCEKVSEACAHCYAEVETYPRVQRAAGRELWGKNADRHRTALSTWRKVFGWDAAARALNVRHRAFVNSLSDFFEDRLDLVQHRRDAWVVIAKCTNLDFLLLTKRPENVIAMLPPDWGNGWPNVWIGCTVENQKRADERLPHLLEVSAAVRFISMEPLLGDVDLTEYIAPAAIVRAIAHHQRTGHDCGGGGDGGNCEECSIAWVDDERTLDWAILGGGSGRDRRVFEFARARSVKQQLELAGVKVFMKQAGQVARDGGGLVQLAREPRKGGDPLDWPEDMRVREFPEVRG